MRSLRATSLAVDVPPCPKIAMRQAVQGRGRLQSPIAVIWKLQGIRGGDRQGFLSVDRTQLLIYVPRVFLWGGRAGRCCRADFLRMFSLLLFPACPLSVLCIYYLVLPYCSTRYKIDTNLVHKNISKYYCIPGSIHE